MYRFMCEPMFFSSVAHICWSGIAEPCGRSCFNYLMNDCQAVSHSSLTIITSHRHSMSVPMPAYLCLHLSSCHYGLSHPRRNEVVLICVSLMINDVEHFFNEHLFIEHHLFPCWSFLCLWRNVYSNWLPVF